MSGIRTVRLLDRRPGEPANEVKEIHGVEIEAGIPLPEKRHTPGRLRQIMFALQVGESFVWPNRAKIDSRVDAGGREYVTRILPDGKFRIWRTK